MTLFALVAVSAVISAVMPGTLSTNLDLQMPKAIPPKPVAYDIYKKHNRVNRFEAIPKQRPLLIQKARRGLVQMAQVELGPGAIKTELVTYPPNSLQNRLKRLLMLKQKNQANKDSNTA